MQNPEELARAVVDRSFKLHKELGPGLLESVYETILATMLIGDGLRVDRQKPIGIEYENLVIPDAFRADLVVENSLIVEIKSVEHLAPVHGKQLLTYLRLTKQPLGLLLNFGAPVIRDGIKRVVNGHTNFASSRLRVHQEA
jgi:iron complex transport system substrate-binding protein